MSGMYSPFLSSIMGTMSSIGATTASHSSGSRRRKLSEGEVEQRRKSILSAMKKNRSEVDRDIDAQKQKPLTVIQRPERMEKAMTETVKSWKKTMDGKAQNVRDSKEQVAKDAEDRENALKERKKAMERTFEAQLALCRTSTESQQKQGKK